MTDLPLQHLSIRVPWHDACWNGKVCNDPTNNASCLRLRNIHERRDDTVEVQLRGRRLDELLPEQQPACISERATFMADFPIKRRIRHPYSEFSDAHKHYLPTPVELPPFSAQALPYRWTLRENAESIADEFDIVFHNDDEEKARQAMGFRSNWIQDIGNQARMLDTFFSAVEPEQSLAFFYAKAVPHTERRGRVLIGVGWITNCGPGIEYDYEPNSQHLGRSMIWERAISHSIRPSNPQGGFLLPYHRAMARAVDDPSVDLEDVVVFAPDEAFDQFSYASEHVSHDQAIASLLAMIKGLERAERSLDTSYTSEIAWAQERLGELWKQRGTYPGLGAALTAFDIRHGHLLAYRITQGLTEAEDPWPAVQAALDDPSSLGPEWTGRVGEPTAKKLARLKDERRELLHLLARFDLTNEQAKRFFKAEERKKAGISLDDTDLLENPYLLYEADRVNATPVSVTVVDRGLYPPRDAELSSPIPSPSAMTEPQDPRRVRALLVSALERAADLGHTLLPQDQLVTEVRDMPLVPPCLIDGDLLAVIDDELEPTVRPAEFSGGTPGLQLDRLAEARNRISNEVRKRSKARRHVVEADWNAILGDLLKRGSEADTAEDRGRNEKVAALKELAEARMSVLVGPAGAGKTTLLEALCSHLARIGAGVTLLAPTGKARVQLERGLRNIGGVRATTIAGFLLKSRRYDPDTGRYQRSSEPKAVTGGTVIIDEASMITEEQLDAVLDNISGAERLILVGDPRQLPPIGAGRPFVDIVEHLNGGAEGRWPKVGSSYAELTVQMRQRSSEAEHASRHDLALGQWFGGETPSASADEAWSEVLSGSQSEHVRFVQWDSPTEVFKLLQQLLVDEIDEIADINDQVGFGKSLGGVDSHGHVYFNHSNDGRQGAGKAAEHWQVIAPIHATGAGVAELNRSVHYHFREDLIESARRKFRKTPKPMGPEGIVYGDKVMNVRNHRHPYVWPKEFAKGSEFSGPDKFVANGEIGMVVGQFRRKGQNFPLNKLEVEFSTQLGAKYAFRIANEADTPDLELAYAITIHKSQGSEFGTTVVVVPNPCRVLSRELLYTALTRHKDRVIVLHEGPLSELLSYSSVRHSETARRFTNLMRNPKPQDVGDGRFLEANLIHRTSNGTLVRSKSEVIVADALTAAGVEFAYEKEFKGRDDTIRIPDFTIEDAATGETYIWEHLGMLTDPGYADAWQRKKRWYADNGVEEGGGDVAMLIVTQDDDRGGIDSSEVAVKVQEIA
ncbi:MAG: AAA family ATPase [Acidimicrobiaceae bacterium]|nr:AAA family ATPase [Acidimicrobiaceae bacterium]